MLKFEVDKKRTAANSAVNITVYQAKMSLFLYDFNIQLTLNCRSSNYTNKKQRVCGCSLIYRHINFDTGLFFDIKKIT